MVDPIQRMLARARSTPNLCAFCGKVSKDQDIDLTTFSETMQVMVDDTVPICHGCLLRYLDYAVGDAILVVGNRSDRGRA